jgi:hypothetical protein
MNSKMMRDTAVSHSIDWLYISFVNINDVNIFRITDGRNVLVANETEMIKIMREIISGINNLS